VLRPDGIEPRLRRLVASELGVTTAELAPGVSLREDFASDDAGVVDLVLAVESRLGVSLPEWALGEVRTYGELVAATLQAVRDARARASAAQSSAVSARVRIVAPDGTAIERSGALTPYLLEGVTEDARRTGSGTSVTVAVAAAATDDQLAAVRAKLAPLERRGVSVRIDRRA
jgi:acyl carrier protein